MRIVIVGKNPFYYRDRDCYLAGHTVGFTYPFVKFLLNRGHKVVMISPSRSSVINKSEEKRFFPLPPDSRNFTHLFIAPKRFPKVPYVFPELNIRSAIMNAGVILKKIDCVMSVYAFPWIIHINEIKRDMGFKTVALLRGSDGIKGCDSDFGYSNVCGRTDWQGISYLFKEALRKSDLVFTTSEWLKKYVENVAIPVHGVTPTPPFQNGDELRNSGSSRTDFKKAFIRHKVIKNQLGRLTVAKPWFVYLGRFHREKRIDIAMTAFSRSKHYRDSWLILGGSGPALSSLKKLRKRLKLDNVKFCFVPPDLVSLLCGSAIAMVQPTLFPNSFIDSRPSSCTNASYVGCPVIAPFTEKRSDFGGAHESLSRLNIDRLTFDPFLAKDEVINNIAVKMNLVYENKRLASDIGIANKQYSSCLEAKKRFRFIERKILSVEERL